MKNTISTHHSKYVDKNNIIIVLLMLILIVLVFGITYSAFIFSGQGDKKNTISTGSLSFTYTENTNGIYLSNAMPISDEVGKKMDSQGNNQNYFDFNISSTITKNAAIYYEVFATPIGVDNPLDWEYVKIYLTDATNDNPILGYDKEIIPTFKELDESELDLNSKRLYYGVFKESGSKNFRLRLWLSNKYKVSADKKMFKLRVGVKASS